MNLSLCTHTIGAYELIHRPPPAVFAVFQACHIEGQPSIFELIGKMVRKKNEFVFELPSFVLLVHLDFRQHIAQGIVLTSYPLLTNGSGA